MFSQSWIVKGNKSFKEPRAHYEMNIFVNKTFTELFSPNSFLMCKNISSEVNRGVGTVR